MPEIARPLFDFKLRGVAEIEPWGKPGALSLSWFSLTDGWYWMNVGADQLFVSHDAGGSFVPMDYQVVRLWEDILDMMPAALEQVPADLGPRLDPDRGWLSWLHRADDWRAAGGDVDLFETAVRWATDRWLDTSHLVAGPNVCFCHMDDRVRISWDNRNRVTDGQPIWTAGCGSAELTVEAFVAEVSGFNDRLMQANLARVFGERDAMIDKLKLGGKVK